MNYVVFDIETDGLLQDMTRIHLLTIKASHETAVRVYREDEIAEGLRYLMTYCHKVYGHNIIKFDIPAIQKLYPWFTIKDPQDTLVLSRLIHADLTESDVPLMRSEKLPSKLYKSHSLEAWGYRLGQMKGEYTGDTRIEDLDLRKASKWAEWNPDMEAYGIQDAVVTEALVAYLAPWDYAQEAVKLEHDVAQILGRQERYGVCFDEASAAALYGRLVARREELATTLASMVPGRLWPSGPVLTPKADNKRFGYLKGAAIQKLEWREFNPSSRAHIEKFFKTRYGWKPVDFTETGEAKIDEGILKKLTYPEATPLMEMLLVEKRISQLSEGTQAWMKVVKNGRIHGSVNTNGAVTGRMTHSYPNLAQVPSCGSPYGSDCRALFGPPKGMVQVGADASGLELRCLAHFMARWDDGAYASEVLNGDIHTVNQKAAGLAERSQAKTFIYGFLYGAGPEKIGSIVGKGRTAGLALRKKFLATLPALAALQSAIGAKVQATKTLRGLDGRILSVRSSHSALNTLLQSAGALIMKKALVILDETLKSEGLVPGTDYEFMLNIHDEFQIATLKEHSDHVASTAVASIRKAGEHFKFRCRLDGEAKIGDSWAATH